MNEVNEESLGNSTPKPEKQAPAQPHAETSQSGVQTSPGYMLASARMAKNVSVEELSAQTMLGRDTVAALEENNFGRMSQPVFVRGYYRKCAKALGLSEDAIMDAYAAWTGVDDPRFASPNRVGAVPRDVTPRSQGSLRLLLLVLVIVVVLVTVWQFLPATRNSGDVLPGTATTTAENNTDAAVSSARSGEIVEEGSAAPPAKLEPVPETTRQPEVAPAADPNAVANAEIVDQDGQRTQTSAVAPAAVNAGMPADGKLRLRFTQRSWIDVRDANNKRMLAGIVPADSERVIDTGTPPYKVALGYAPGVEVYVGDKRVDLTDKTKSDNTARFTVKLKQ